MPRRPNDRSAKHRAVITVVLLAVATAGLAGCGGDHTGDFQSVGGSQNCQIHQSAAPGTHYTGGVNGDTESILAMMSYYTAHGRQPFCDGHPATQIDQAWSGLYTKLGGDPAHVKP
jgi:hypothetical protein